MKPALELGSEGAVVIDAVENSLVTEELLAELIVVLLEVVGTRRLVGVTGKPEKEEFGQATVCVKLENADVENDETEESAWDSKEDSTAECEIDGITTSAESSEAVM